MEQVVHGLRSRISPNPVLSWLFPQACSLCGEAGAPLNPCRDCCRALDPLLLGSVCPRCATPTTAEHEGFPAPIGDTAEHCPACLVNPPPFDRVVAPWSFGPPLASLVHRMKYSRDLAAAAALGRLLARELAVRTRRTVPEVVIGLPLSRRRLLQRGFNHAEELATMVRRNLGLRRPGSVRIVRHHSPPQARARNAAERFANVEKAFTVRRWPAGTKRVAIVDDVLTTGATASALSLALRERDVEWIEVWCCARATLD